MLRWTTRKIKKFNKTSVWLKVALILILLLIVYHIHNQTIKEGFIQQKEFLLKEGPEIYDDFYSEIYDDLIYDEVKNEFEVGEIINITQPTKQSRVLDIGSGTGRIVKLFKEKGIPAEGLELSSSMISKASENFPKCSFKHGDATRAITYSQGNFTHITCLYFTLYYIRNKEQFFRNCYSWLMPGGYLIISLVNRDQFDPILNTADPLMWVSAQKYAKERITSSVVKFKDFQYKANFDLDKPDDLATFTETMKDDKTGNVRKNIHRLFMPTQKHIISLAKNAGFVLQGKVDLVNIQYEYQYLYILYKPS